MLRTDAEYALRALRRGLVRARGFALFVAICDQPVQRDRLIDELARALPNTPPAIVRVPPHATDLWAVVIEQAGAPPDRPVMVVDLEKAVPSGDPRHPILVSLNLSRPEWPKRAPVPVVFWVPDYLLQLLLREAPDFMDWRSDTVYVPPLDETEAAPLYDAAWRGGTDGSWDAETRRARMAELESRIRMYERQSSERSRRSVARWLSELGNHYRLLGHIEEAEQMFRKSLKISERLGYLEGMAADYVNLGNVRHIQGDLDHAEQMYRKALHIQERDGNLKGMAATYGNLGVIKQHRGDLEDAEEMFRKALCIDEQLGNREGAASDYGNLGILKRIRGDVTGAEEMHHIALDIHEQRGDREGMASDYGNLGVAKRCRGDLDGAEEMHCKALEIDEQLGRLEGMATAYSNLGHVKSHRGDLDGAEAMYLKSLELNERLHRPEGIAAVYGNLGPIMAARGNVDRARRMGERARGLYAQLGNTQDVRRIDEWLAALQEREHS